MPPSVIASKRRGRVAIGGDAQNPYCRHCTDRGGALLPYASVLKYLVENEYMARNGMARAQAEAAARGALSRMPAWKGVT